MTAECVCPPGPSRGAGDEASDLCYQRAAYSCSPDMDIREASAIARFATRGGLP